MVVQDIFIYPIKSLGGIRLDQAEVEEKGFKYDRRWMLIDSEGLFVSQRTYPKLALLGVELTFEGLLVYQKKRQYDSILIPYTLAPGEEVSVVVWDDTMKARLLAEQYDQWFSEFLDKEVRLVIMPESTRRAVSPKYAVNAEAVSFADGMPYLLIGQESLEDLNRRLEQPVPMDRFRPNIVFSGGEAFKEDSLQKIQIGEVAFQIVKPCARCVMTTVNQNTAETSKEPLKTLASYRTVGNKVLFGQNMVALGEGVVRIGDKIEVLN
ncbi:MOSC domain-containing protein [Algoriphagus formosus]|uniref:MOSC domain-containing protein n=1 Tax=Algoriphagus formosus TaxID=2007308 RepID=A0A4R5VCC6_9BACT|nr:MOSC N-terminal beta barrel domain-containing protein [Algoriphagus aquimaris]TDK49968.1 MOSC domain-containing protein [Algoriphagus aquimaris]